MQYFAPDLVFINLGENDYALTDSEFLTSYSAIVERVQDALPGVPVFSGALVQRQPHKTRFGIRHYPGEIRNARI
ncbi:SGNH/GDSL hydrolase family protein [Klebsiella pneumoniae subsp. pneumoniae]|nr:SGNH/GDSL hydrolase family protein [Klebsiella pneumoniae subsp. pneumoniae]